MNGFIALKTAVFNGITYPAGTTIPPDAVLPSRVPTLVRNNVIKAIDNPADFPENGSDFPCEGVWESVKVNLPILTENGVMELPTETEDIITVVRILQMKKDEAISAIADVASEDALIILDACTKAQDIKKAIREKVKALGGDA